jgi:L-2-hydroxyglutarate oxidase LhgO
MPGKSVLLLEKEPDVALHGSGRNSGVLHAGFYYTANSLKARFTRVAADLLANEAKINAELIGAQGKPVDLGGYYQVDPVKTGKAMRPSPTLNAIIDGIA